MGSYTESVSSTGVRETYILSPPSDEATSLRLNSQISSKMAVPSANHANATREENGVWLGQDSHPPPLLRKQGGFLVYDLVWVG
jgi:hypothetical protein